jgi:hypothetical protein
MKPFDWEYKIISGLERLIFIEIQQFDSELSDFPINQKLMKLFTNENHELVRSTPVPKLSPSRK